MTKNILFFVAIIVAGALIGSVIGQLIGNVLPEGPVRDAFTKEITAGLNPTQLDLRIIDLTFGCVLKFNIMSILGILIAAYIFKIVVK